MNRRGFLQSILALGIAPAVARASSLMPIRVLEKPLIGFTYMGIERATYHWWKDPLVDTNIVPSVILYGDGIRDDTFALQTWINGGSVLRPDGTIFSGSLLSGESFLITNTIKLASNTP